MASTENGDAHPAGKVSAWPQREPRTFSGKSDEDVEDWLKHYQRVSKYNRWDQAVQLANVVFFLAGTALLWFENHEDTLATWDTFVNELKKCFSDTVSKKKRAEQTLAQRAQTPGETCTRYIEEVLKLCSLVSGTMSDEDKVGHLLKGIAEDVYNFLITKDDIASPTDVVSHCRAFEKLKTQRILPKFGRLANVTTVASVDVGPSDDIALMIRRIVREELGQHFPHVSSDQEYHKCGTPSPVYQQCALQQASCVDPPAPWIRQTYMDQRAEYRATPASDATFRPQPRQFVPRNEVPLRRAAAGYYVEPPRREPAGSYRPQGPSTGATTYNEPRVCYNCGLRGHISRFCQRRRQQYSRPPSRSDPASFERSTQSSAMRSTSPASDRSFTPPPMRQARSPSPRRGFSPPPLHQLGN